jgi:hypothetical protein
MKLFIAQQAALNSENPDLHFSKVVECFANYIRAPQRKTVELLIVSENDMKAFGVERVSTHWTPRVAKDTP